MSSSPTSPWKTYPKVAAPRQAYQARSNVTPPNKRSGARFCIQLLVITGILIFLVITVVSFGKMQISGFSRAPLGIHSQIQHSKQQQNLRATTSTKDTPPLQASPPDPHDAAPAVSATPPPMAVVEALFLLGQANASALLERLETSDPLGIKSRPQDFTCPPPEQRLDYPSLVNDSNAAAFRAKQPGSFIFYQHLRKAGGTSFCELCKSNLPRRQVPPYYCMPDQKGSLATPPWSDAVFLVKAMAAKDFKVAANEWDAYYDKHKNIPGAVLATTFRHPIDRWYSQYRFEHLEHRDGSKKGDPLQTFYEYYRHMQGWTMDRNYYTTTFWGVADKAVPRNAKGDFYWTYHKFKNIPIDWAFFSKSLDNVRAFHLLLVTEYLSEAGPMIERTLGWGVPPKQVLPHEVQAPRDEKRKKNIPTRVLVKEQYYLEIAAENVIDILMYDVVRRIWLERHACEAADRLTFR